MFLHPKDTFRKGADLPSTDVEPGEPIDFLVQGNERLRAVARMMSILADDLWHNGRECFAHCILEFFEGEWPLLLEDEERLLLPRLLAREETRATARRLQMTMEYDHNLIRQAFHDLEEGLCALRGGASPLRPAVFAISLIQTEELLREHAAAKERTLYPWARRWLTQPDKALMWREMTERRGCSHLR